MAYCWWTAVGNAVTPPAAEGLNLRWTNWSVGGTANDDHTFGAKSLTVINTKGLVLTNSPGILYNSAISNTPTFSPGSSLLLAMDGVKPGHNLIAVKDSAAGNAINGQWTKYYTSSRLVEHGTPVATGNDISMPIRLRNLDQTLAGTSTTAKKLLAAMATQMGVDTSQDPMVSQGQRFLWIWESSPLRVICTPVRKPASRVMYTVSNHADVVDDLTLDGTLGLELSKGPLSVNINYNYQHSTHRNGNAVFAELTYTFSCLLAKVSTSTL